MIKNNRQRKLIFLINILIICLFFAININASEQNAKDKLITFGKNNAPIKIKVFSSLTCPHCASFHTEVIPKLLKYVNTGKVQIIFIDFPLDQAAFNASKLLHCVDDKKQMKLLDSIYENQKQWVSGSTIEQINNNLKIIVKSFGLDEIEFNKCVNNDLISDRILNGRINAHKKYSIESTPTIVINEEKLKGANDFNNIKKQIEKKI
jgi:protein-disulfide isomerase